MSDPYTEWCHRHNCSHGHCPVQCPKPQPILLENGRLVCGRCAVYLHEFRDMIPCTPEICEEAQEIRRNG